MPSKTPHNNGKKPVNGVHKDTEMKDASKPKGKKGAKDGEDEMTVVVPPSKGKKGPVASTADADGDVSMGDENAGEQVDPAEQTVTGRIIVPSSLHQQAVCAHVCHEFNPFAFELQISRAILLC